MVRMLIVVLCVLAMISGCENGGSAYIRLEQADSLIAKELDDSALHVLKSINIDDLKTVEERAYYNLLMTCAQYRLFMPITSTSTIDVSLDYYRNARDERNLARALYYKGMVMYELGETKTSIKCLKEAENIASQENYQTILNYVYINLAAINTHIGNYQTSIDYAKKSMAMAEKRGNKGLICLSLDRIACNFNFMERQDSDFYYMKKAIPYLKYLKEKEKPDVLTNVSVSFLNQDLTDKAERYVRQSISIVPTAHAYYVLGLIYFERGQDNEAFELWNNVVHSGAPEVRVEAMRWIAEFKKEHGQYREAAELMDLAERMSDSIRAAKKPEVLLKQQVYMEQEASERASTQRLIIIVSAASVVVLILILFTFWQRKRLGKAKRVITSCERKIEACQQKIGELYVSKVTHEKDTEKLNKKIEVLRKRRAAIIGHGRKCYEEIIEGGTVAAWGKDDFEAVIEYCRTIRHEEVENIEKSYKGITSYNVFFLLLPSFGVLEQDVPRVMNVSPGAVRTMKYRLKKKSLLKREERSSN